MRIKYLLPVLLAASLSTAAFANPFETTLKNGLRIIVKEDHRAPTAVQMVWYRIGSIDEVDGHSGVAHVLEHMMFKGTPSVGPGEFNKRVARANAAALAASVRFVESDWFAALDTAAGFDFIVSNPPYIAENDPHLAQGDVRFEPATALASGNTSGI